MWEDARWKEYFKVGGTRAIVFGAITAAVGWYVYDLSESILLLCGVAGWFFWTLLQWMDAATNGLSRIEAKLDDIESELDEIKLNADSPDDRPHEMDY